MTMHAGLASGRWWTLTLAEQLGNAGADVGRAVRARQQGDQARFDAALDRALELLDAYFLAFAIAARRDR